MKITPPRGQSQASFGRRFFASNFGGLQLGRLLCSLTLVLGLGLPLTADAQTATGSVSGRVQNVGNGKYLNNVRITLEGSNRATATNEFGEYRLDNVPAGEAKVRAFYTGLDSEVSTVTVTAGQSTALDFNLTSQEHLLE